MLHRFAEINNKDYVAKAATGTGRVDAIFERFRFMLSISWSVAAVR
jgi:hypothetical protein